MTFTSKAYGATGAIIAGKKLEEMDIEREHEKENEVLIEVLYCGVCHSDIHQVANDWKNTIYPCVPGHEVIGRVSRVGNAVTKCKTGDIVGVGCMIDSCHTCKPCKNGDEQFCAGPQGQTMTYNGYFNPDGSKEFNTFGGYSTHIVANEDFILKIPSNLELSAAAPLLCAGVTTYSPLKARGIKEGDKVAVVGIGGLGHLAVMIAKAMGAKVTAITTKEEKRQEAFSLGADDVLISENEDAMNQNEQEFDFILVTIPEPFDVNPYVKLLAARGSLVTVGLLAPYKKPVDNMEVAKLNRSIGGSLIGGIAETQEALDFFGDHHILPKVQMINMDEINDAFDKIKEEDVRFRFVIDMQSLK